jgi:hypothetical protein
MNVIRAVQLQPNQKGNTSEDKTISRKHHCVSHIFHGAHGGSNEFNRRNRQRLKPLVQYILKIARSLFSE